MQTSLVGDVLKSKWSPTARKQLALSTIEVRYLSDQWLREYTDGSQEKNDKSGAGIYSSFCTHFSVGWIKTNLDTKMEPISYVFLYILNLY